MGPPRAWEPAHAPHWGIVVSSRRFPFYPRAWAGSQALGGPLWVPCRPRGVPLSNAQQMLCPLISPAMGCDSLNSRQGQHPLTFRKIPVGDPRTLHGPFFGPLTQGPVLSPTGGNRFISEVAILSQGVGGPQAPGGPLWAPCKPLPARRPIKPQIDAGLCKKPTRKHPNPFCRIG